MRSVAGGKLRYEAFGPFSFRPANPTLHKEALKEFWSERPDELAGAVGVYVWTYKKGGARVPWNVGLTSKQGFKRRFEQKGVSFRDFVYEDPDADIDVFLLALRSAKGSFKKPTRSKKLPGNDWLETVLIGAAISVNPSLRNSSKSKYLRNAVVDGYLNDKKENRSPAARSFNEIFHPRPRKRK